MICSCTVMNESVPKWCNVDGEECDWQEFHPETDGRFC